MKQTLECNACKARIEVERGGRVPAVCGIPQDGGGSCRGRMLPVVYAQAGGLSGRALTAQEAARPENQATAYGALFNVGASVTQVENALRGIHGMTRGGVFPGGMATAVLSFRNEDARAEFAALLDSLGIRITA